MKNKINDLFNAYNAETKQSNPERSTLPRARGKDNLDIVIRSRRLDRINNFSESPSQKLPINYGYLTTNYMPAVNPMAAPMTAEEVQNRFDGSVTATRVRNAMATGEVDALESELRQMDDLLPTESLQLVQGEDQMPRIQIVSMFDPENVASLEPEEIVSDIDAETEAELAILDAQDGTVPPQDIAKVLSAKLDQLYADGGRSPIIPALESELEKIYQQLESQAQEQEAATEDVVEAPEVTEVDIMNSPADLIAQAVDNYNSGKVDNATQTLPEYIRSVVNEAGALQIPPDVTDEQIMAAAK
jgi:TolA-binding protein